MALRNTGGDAGEEEQHGALRAADLVQEPVGVVLAALRDETGCDLGWIGDIILPLNGLLACRCGRRVIVIVDCCLACGWLLLKSSRSMGICSDMERKEAFKMLTEGLPELVGRAVEDTRVDYEDGSGDQGNGDPARPAVIRGREPPDEGHQSNNQPNMWPNSCQDGCSTCISWTRVWLDTDIHSRVTTVTHAHSLMQLWDSRLAWLGLRLPLKLVQGSLVHGVCFCLYSCKWWHGIGNGSVASLSQSTDGALILLLKSIQLLKQPGVIMVLPLLGMARILTGSTADHRITLWVSMRQRHLLSLGGTVVAPSSVD